jgi:hypothetical protein
VNLRSRRRRRKKKKEKGKSPKLTRTGRTEKNPNSFGC